MFHISDVVFFGSSDFGPAGGVAMRGTSEFGICANFVHTFAVSIGASGFTLPTDAVDAFFVGFTLPTDTLLAVADGLVNRVHTLAIFFGGSSLADMDALDADFDGAKSLRFPVLDVVLYVESVDARRPGCRK